MRTIPPVLRLVACAGAVATFLSGGTLHAQVAAQPDATVASAVLAPRGYVQFDVRAYPDWPIATGTGRLEHETLEMRRIRVGFDGQWRRFNYELSLDPQDFDGTLVKDAYLDVRLRRGLRLRGGQFKLPGSSEYGRSARALEFLERSSLAESIAPGRDIGVMLIGTVGPSYSYEAGVFGGDGNGRRSRSGPTVAGRLAWRGVADLEIGAGGSVGHVSTPDTEPANGFEGRSPAGFRFFDRVYVEGQRVRLAANATWTPGRWRLTSEFMRASDDRFRQGLDMEDLPSVVGTGWIAAVTRQLGRRQPRSRWREVEIGLRWDVLRFDDSGADTGRESVRPRATDIRARGAQSATATLVWSPTRWTRIISNGGLERYSEARASPEAGRRGPYWVLGSRLQIELP